MPTGRAGPPFRTATLVPVTAGQTLVGIMTLTGYSSLGYNYNCQFQGIANSRLHAISNVEQLTYCVETLEAYGITK